MRTTRPIRLLLGIGALLVVTGVVGVALAAIPDDQGVYTGCYGKASGQLRVIDSSQSCKNNERRITWNQSGPQGEPGPAGGSLPGGAMVHREFAGYGGVGAVPLVKGEPPKTLATIELATLPGEPSQWETVTAFGSIQLANNGTETARVGCTLGWEDWLFSVLPAMPGIDGNEEQGTTSFVSPAGLSDENPTLELKCAVSEWGPPGVDGTNIQVAGVTLTVYPLAYLDYGEDD